MAHSVEVVINF